MDLILWRHAEAEDGAPDAKRRLTARGRKQAKQVARWLKKRLPADARILSSPAVRAMQTAQALERPFEEAGKLGTAASAASLLGAVGWPQGGGTVVVVGHQPTLGRAAALLLTGDAAEWSVRKGALWWFTCRVRNGVSETVLRAVVAPDLV
ncbi:MAG: histidine phosphatase family protein [Rhodocyclaceae bacterium]|nr:MAG: histidine phosphatase family protein [Rhodocyclaceae bacterium]CAG0929684.1 putative phosphoglycerate mutase [Rhodocyclaceae bacterium]